MVIGAKREARVATLVSEHARTHAHEHDGHMQYDKVRSSSAAAAERHTTVCETLGLDGWLSVFAPGVCMRVVWIGQHDIAIWCPL